jgi:hypothetical protein
MAGFGDGRRYPGDRGGSAAGDLLPLRPRPREGVRYLPKWAWAIVCLISIPLGAIVYLVLGRQS